MFIYTITHLYINIIILYYLFATINLFYFSCCSSMSRQNVSLVTEISLRSKELHLFKEFERRKIKETRKKNTHLNWAHSCQTESNWILSEINNIVMTKRFDQLHKMVITNCSMTFHLLFLFCKNLFSFFAFILLISKSLFYRKT